MPKSYSEDEGRLVDERILDWRPKLEKEEEDPPTSIKIISITGLHQLKREDNSNIWRRPMFNSGIYKYKSVAIET